MLSERGYIWRLRPGGNAGLARPVYDVENGIVLSPRPDGIQVSTGTELCTPDCAPRKDQATRALAAARSLLPLESPGPSAPEFADRPTLSDSLPAIGPVAALPGVWLNTGHQHVGFSTAPGSASLLAAQIANETTPIAAQAFDPARFG